MREVTVRRFVISLIVLAFGALALPLASSSQVSSGGARNLAVTPKIKHQLRVAYVASPVLVAHRGRIEAALIRGPIKGPIHYGRYRARGYAIANFSIPTYGTQYQPEVFSRSIGGRWFDRGESGGMVCSNMVPIPLLNAWKLTVYAEKTTAGRRIQCFA